MVPLLYPRILFGPMRRHRRCAARKKKEKRKKGKRKENKKIRKIRPNQAETGLHCKSIQPAVDYSHQVAGLSTGTYLVVVVDTALHVPVHPLFHRLPQPTTPRTPRCLRIFAVGLYVRKGVKVCLVPPYIHSSTLRYSLSIPILLEYFWAFSLTPFFFPFRPGASPRTQTLSVVGFSFCRAFTGKSH